MGDAMASFFIITFSLIFAGEATHQEYKESVHGALLNRVKAAEKIVSVAFPS